MFAARTAHGDIQTHLPFFFIKRNQQIHQIQYFIQEFLAFLILHYIISYVSIIAVKFFKTFHKIRIG